MGHILCVPFFCINMLYMLSESSTPVYLRGLCAPYNPAPAVLSLCAMQRERTLDKKEKHAVV